MNDTQRVQQGAGVESAIAIFTNAIDAAAHKSGNQTRFKLTLLKEFVEIMIAYDGGFTAPIGWSFDQRHLVEGSAVRNLMQEVGPSLRKFSKETQEVMYKILAADLSRQVLTQTDVASLAHA